LPVNFIAVCNNVLVKNKRPLYTFNAFVSDCRFGTQTDEYLWLYDLKSRGNDTNFGNNVKHNFYNIANKTSKVRRNSDNAVWENKLLCILWHFNNVYRARFEWLLAVLRCTPYRNVACHQWMISFRIFVWMSCLYLQGSTVEAASDLIRTDR
jgi:hypothetical protein